MGKICRFECKTGCMLRVPCNPFINLEGFWKQTNSTKQDYPSNLECIFVDQGNTLHKDTNIPLIKELNKPLFKTFYAGLRGCKKPNN